jgi:hypothetical protein
VLIEDVQCFYRTHIRSNCALLRGKFGRLLARSGFCRSCMPPQLKLEAGHHSTRSFTKRFDNALSTSIPCRTLCLSQSRIIKAERVHIMAKEELKLRSMLDEDKAQYNDCLACRVVGMAFLLPPINSMKSSKFRLLTKLPRSDRLCSCWCLHVHIWHDIPPRKQKRDPQEWLHFWNQISSDCPCWNVPDAGRRRCLPPFELNVNQTLYMIPGKASWTEDDGKFDVPKIKLMIWFVLVFVVD